MKKLVVLFLMSLFVLSACGNDKDLNGKYDVAVGEKGNVDYQLIFEKDNKVTAIYPAYKLEDTGTYSISKEKNKDGEYILTFDNFDHFGQFVDKDGYFFNPEKMTLTEGQNKYEDFKSDKKKLVKYDGLKLFLLKK
ncbi:hypothetical protein RW115_12080 [Macrococcus capreoli]